MNSTAAKWVLHLGLLCFATCIASISSASSAVPRPAELERDVRFWVRVYSEITTDAGFLHDERDLSVVYATLRFPPKTLSRERQPVVDRERTRYVNALRRIASGASPLSAEEERVREMWGPNTSAVELSEAAERIRFQLGQADRFRAGLERSGKWQEYIAATFARYNLPPELVVLPHVESSFNPAAYSKVGAAGMWQFMRSTGRRYMRIDEAVDERLDPYRATEAAAQLLSYNYRLLGSWPLALTAYNHGAAGMRRAKEAMGTDDIATIVRRHRSPSFGFASRNFYVSFLAALEIDSKPERYFADIKLSSPIRFQEIELPARITASALTRALGIDPVVLNEFNPAVRPAVWQGKRSLPKGYRVYLPAEGPIWTTALLTERLNSSTGSVTKPAVEREVVAATTVAAQIESARDVKAVVTVGKSAARAEPVTAAQAEALGPSLGPALETPQSPDPTEYAVAPDNTLIVAADETLGHYAEWLETSSTRLRQINKMKARAPVLIGRRLKLEFSKISRERFEQQRREYHRVLQASYFARYRITGTGVYTVRRGDSLWTVRDRVGRLPVWLLQQYNPDIDLNQMRAGIEIVVPKVEELTVAGETA
jgi:membrane-bound lytic murein transglycosylase D